MKQMLISIIFLTSFTAFATDKNATAAAAPARAYSAEEIRAAAQEKDRNATIHAAADEKRASAAVHSSATTTNALQRLPAVNPFQSSKKNALDGYVIAGMNQLTQHADYLRDVFYNRIAQQMPGGEKSIQVLCQKVAGTQLFIRGLDKLIAEYAASERSPDLILTTALASFSPEELGGRTVLQFLESEKKALKEAFTTIGHAMGDKFHEFFSDTMEEDLTAREGLTEQEIELYNKLGFQTENDSWFSCPHCKAQFKSGWDHAYYHAFCRHTKVFAFDPLAIANPDERLQHVLQAIDLESRKALDNRNSGWQRPRPPLPDHFKAWEMLHGILNGLQRKRAEWNTFINDYELEEENDGNPDEEAAADSDTAN